MNILYIVGNGLDIQYGLKTKYSDFYEYQLPIYEEKKITENYFNIIYDNILKDQNTNWENWSDLELALGELTKNSEIDEEEFMIALDDVNIDLNNYLTLIEGKFDLTEKKIDIQSNLKSMFNQIPDGLKGRILEYIKSFPIVTDYITVLTLNYTSILDQLIEKEKGGKYKSFRNHDYGCFIKNVEHAHGTLEFSLILGVSDETQLNKEYKKSNKKYLIKETIHEQARENRHFKNINLISQADLIIIFGTSIGATDGYIWKKIAEYSIKKNMPIIIHCYKEDFETVRKIPRQLGILYESIENNFIEKSGIEDETKIKILKNNIIPIISKKVFEIKEEIKN